MAGPGPLAVTGTPVEIIPWLPHRPCPGCFYSTNRRQPVALRLVPSSTKKSTDDSLLPLFSWPCQVGCHGRLRPVSGESPESKTIQKVSSSSFSSPSDLY